MVDYFLDLLNEKALVASTLIAASAYLLKVWGESKRDARYVLYLLMDLRKSLLGYKVQMNKAGAPMADSIADEIKKNGGDVPAEELEKAKQQLEGFMSGLSSILFDYQHQLFADHDLEFLRTRDMVTVCDYIEKQVREHMVDTQKQQSPHKAG